MGPVPARDRRRTASARGAKRLVSVPTLVEARMTIRPGPEAATAVEPTLILTAADVQATLTMDDCIAAVERVFASFARGETHAPGVLGFHVEGGGFHIKVAAADLGRPYFAAKTNGNFPDNPKRRGLPMIQGAIVLS